jgi:sporulation protein YlmC with PRC-barrel domain
MIGNAVYDVQNRKIGSIKDLILDRDGKVAEVVVDVGSFLAVGGKYVAIDMSDIKADNNRLTLDRTKEQLQQMAEYRRGSEHRSRDFDITHDWRAAWSLTGTAIESARPAGV